MEYEKIRKLVVLGHRGVGKTSLILRYTENTFVDNYYPTIEDIHTKTIVYHNNQYKFSIVDTAGQDEFSMLNPQYTIGVDLYVIVFSVASNVSFEMVTSIRDKILDQTGLESLPMVLVGSKSDLDYARQVSKEDAVALAKVFNCNYIECSAKAEVNIGKFFSLLLLPISVFSLQLTYWFLIGVIFEQAINMNNSLIKPNADPKDSSSASNCLLM
ncbi:GTP-binding protein rhb1 [Smittium mucronatum]|uniref:GTP-binding protein rhb1 n=1 Tax=Smittium mucronatum TaxID=133383 RepID=A0A1R0GM25_9FUNG|nr:GTP-binding protein rhb1 [Smittium mucronatum]